MSITPITDLGNTQPLPDRDREKELHHGRKYEWIKSHIENLRVEDLGDEIKIERFEYLSNGEMQEKYFAFFNQEGAVSAAPLHSQDYLLELAPTEEKPKRTRAEKNRVGELGSSKVFYVTNRYYLEDDELVKAKDKTVSSLLPWAEPQKDTNIERLIEQAILKNNLSFEGINLNTNVQLHGEKRSISNKLEMTLADICQKEDAKPLPTEQIVPIVHSVLKALWTYAKINLIHGDIKLENIMLDKDGKAFIIDHEDAEFNYGSAKGTSYYMTIHDYIESQEPEEMPEDSENNHKRRDMLAFGQVLLNLMLTGRDKTTPARIAFDKQHFLMLDPDPETPCFSEYREEDIDKGKETYLKLAVNDYPAKVKALTNDAYPQPLYDCLERLFAVNFEERYTAAELLEELEPIWQQNDKENIASFNIKEPKDKSKKLQKLLDVKGSIEPSSSAGSLHTSS